MIQSFTDLGIPYRLSIIRVSIIKDVKAEGFDVTFVVVDGDRSDIDSSLKTMLFGKHLELVRNSFASFSKRDVDVWIEPKKALSADEKVRINQDVESFFEFLNWAMQLTPAPTRYSILSHGALSCKYDRSYGYVHAPVTHAASISGDATPLTHRVASLLKRWWLGTHQGAISPEHLAYYLDEFTFRFNRRTSRSRGKLFYRLIEQALQINPVPAKTIIHNI